MRRKHGKLHLEGVQAAQAQTLPAGEPGTVLAAAPPAEEDQPPEAEKEEGEEEIEECTLSSAEASVSANLESDTVRLVVRYRTFSPAAVAIECRLHGGGGSLSLGRSTRRFSRSGVFRETERLSASRMAKVMAAREFTVELRAVNSPGFCRDLFDQRLSARHATGAGLPLVRTGGRTPLRRSQRPWAGQLIAPPSASASQRLRRRSH